MPKKTKRPRRKQRAGTDDQGPPATAESSAPGAGGPVASAEPVPETTRFDQVKTRLRNPKESITNFWGTYGTYITGALTLIAVTSITGIYYFNPGWYFVVPCTMIICVICSNVDESGSFGPFAKHVGLSLGLGLVLFFLLRVMSTYGWIVDKGWLDKKYCEEVKEEDSGSGS
jgi:hypothetical protein